MNWQDNITVDPLVCHGKACIKGTRIMVKNIIGMIAGGYTLDRLLSGID